ncbi:MAG: LysE family translocator, partial [Aeromonas sp.]
MDLDSLWPLIGFAFITCITPGPNNMLLTSASAARGFRRSIPLLFGVVGGINVMILA